jgi:hypothetical protein
MPAPPATSELFATDHYAAGIGQRVRRSFELGPRYYLVDIPRYLRQRRRLDLPVLDWRALWNPVRSFRPEVYVDLPAPPRYVEALDLMRRAGVQFSNTPRRIGTLSALWWDARTAEGDVIECGAYRGATSLLLAVLGKLNGVAQRVLMFDTFAGTPPPSRYDSSRRTGEFALPVGWPATIAEQSAALGVADRTEVHQGLFADSFARLAPRARRFAFAHIDANIFDGTRDACEFCLPRMSPGAAVVFDDYNGLLDLGARLAIDAHLAASGRGDRPQPLAECSAYLRM